MAERLKLPIAVPTEAQCVRIHTIDAYDALGCRGIARGEHSGANAPEEPADLLAELADNAPSQLGFRRRTDH